MIAEITEGTLVEECTDVHPTKTETYRTYTSKVVRQSGYWEQISPMSEIAQLLDGLELEETNRNKESITYNIPTFRPDLEREVDLIEEVGRLYDYNNIPAPEAWQVHITRKD
ncbi:MAG: hypothetical protein U5J95_01215 [Balneolaceae bacterium]|nr:hypothetical protein [Balneolaceae bacterium]